MIHAFSRGEKKRNGEGLSYLIVNIPGFDATFPSGQMTSMPYLPILLAGMVTAPVILDAVRVLTPAVKFSPAAEELVKVTVDPGWKFVPDIA